MANDSLSRLLELGHNMDRDTTTPPIEKIAGLFPRGYFSIYAAQAGTGKTWFMQYLACKLSIGGNILAGLVPKSKKYKTVIMSGETGKIMLDQRLGATCWEYDPKRIRVYDAVELQREDIPIMLNTAEGRTSIVAILAHEKPDLVYFDTLISFHTTDESKQGEITSIYTFLLKTAKAFDCAIVLNHHTRKRSTKNPTARYTQDDVIGSNTGVRLAAKVYLAEQVQEEGTGESEGMPTVNVHNVKSWDKKIPDFSYQFIYDEGTGLIDFAIDWGRASVANEEWSLRERVAKYVESIDAGGMITLEAISSALVTSKDSARKYLDELVKRDILERVKLMNATVWLVRKTS